MILAYGGGIRDASRSPRRAWGSRGANRTIAEGRVVLLSSSQAICKRRYILSGLMLMSSGMLLLFTNESMTHLWGGLRHGEMLGDFLGMLAWVGGYVLLLVPLLWPE